MPSRLPRLTVAALAAAVALSSASSAHATPPTVDAHHDEGILTLPDLDCGSFTLHERMLSEDLVITTFHTQSGDRVQVHYDFLGEITNSATGETFRDHTAGHTVSEGGLQIHNGIAFNIVRPGQGAILQLIGRRLVDNQGNILAVLAGPDDTEGDFVAALCAALA